MPFFLYQPADSGRIPVVSDDEHADEKHFPSIIPIAILTLCILHLAAAGYFPAAVAKQSR